MVIWQALHFFSTGIFFSSLYTPPFQTMPIIISQNTVCHFWRIKHSFPPSPKITCSAELWMKMDLRGGFVCSMLFPLRVAPYPGSPRAPSEVYTLCFNRWAGWRLLGYKTGTGKLLGVVLNWMLIKFMDIHWPRQTRQIQTCLHTHSSYTP